jgi:phage terminase small subunit
MAKLTDKQIRFCEEYVIDWNGTRAAIASGYSENSAKEIASENLTKPNIQAYIEEIQKDLSKLSGVTALRNILELKKLAYTNMSDFKDGWITQKEFDKLDENTKAALSEIQYVEKSTQHGDESIVKFKLHDKMKAIEGLNKMLGFNAPEKLQVEETILTENDRLKRIADLKKKLKP